MNSKQFAERRRFLQTIRISNRSGSHINCFRYFPNNSDEHEDKKFEIFKRLRKEGHDVLVEPIFHDEGRCDVLDLTDGVIYEVIHTEKEADVKKKNYPGCFMIEIVKATGVE